MACDTVAVGLATGGPLVTLAGAVFVVGWIAIAMLIWSGYGSHDPVDIEVKPSYPPDTARASASGLARSSMSARRAIVRTGEG